MIISIFVHCMPHCALLRFPYGIKGSDERLISTFKQRVGNPIALEIRFIIFSFV